MVRKRHIVVFGSPEWDRILADAEAACLRVERAGLGRYSDEPEVIPLHPFEGVEDDYYWCLHCERVHWAEAWAAKKWCCPTRGCDGRLRDAQPWTTCRARQAWPAYPEVPQDGWFYGLLEQVIKA